MMCRVIAPVAGWLRREAAERSPDRCSPTTPWLPRRLRMARRRALRWFSVPIAVSERARRGHDPAPSLWAYGFGSGPGRRVEPLRRMRRGRRVSLIRAGY